jgi:hypothetical protein
VAGFGASGVEPSAPAASQSVSQSTTKLRVVILSAHREPSIKSRRTVRRIADDALVTPMNLVRIPDAYILPASLHIFYTERKLCSHLFVIIFFPHRFRRKLCVKGALLSFSFKNLMKFR